MAVHQIATLNKYVKFLQQTPIEVEALFRDLLIGVTNFFRDPPAFKALEAEVIPKLFADKPAGGTLRVWVPGCSTGEEAYSIAILLAERQATLKQAFQIQVFATDIDSQAIDVARIGLYPASISAAVTPERLAKRGWVAVCAAEDAACLAAAPKAERLDLTLTRHFLGHVGRPRGFVAFLVPPSGG